MHDTDASQQQKHQHNGAFEALGQVCRHIFLFFGFTVFEL
jgi:hypothetical protein